MNESEFSKYTMDKTLLKSIKSIENMIRLNAMTDKQFFDLKFLLSYGLKDKIKDIFDSEIYDLISDIDSDDSRTRESNESDKQIRSPDLIHNDILQLL